MARAALTCDVHMAQAANANAHTLPRRPMPPPPRLVLKGGGVWDPKVLGGGGTEQHGRLVWPRRNAVGH